MYVNNEGGQNVRTSNFSCYVTFTIGDINVLKKLHDLKLLRSVFLRFVDVYVSFLQRFAATPNPLTRNG